MKNNLKKKSQDRLLIVDNYFLNYLLFWTEKERKEGRKEREREIFILTIHFHFAQFIADRTLNCRFANAIRRFQWYRTQCDGAYTRAISPSRSNDTDARVITFPERVRAPRRC